MSGVFDELTRTVMEIRIEISPDLNDVQSDQIVRCRARDYFTSNSGPEFDASELKEWAGADGTQSACIEPELCWAVGYRESVNTKPGDELQNGELYCCETKTKTVSNTRYLHCSVTRLNSPSGYISYCLRRSSLGRHRHIETNHQLRRRWRPDPTYTKTDVGTRDWGRQMFHNHLTLIAMKREGRPKG